MISLFYNKNWNLWINVSKQLSVMTSAVRLTSFAAWLLGMEKRQIQMLGELLLHLEGNMGHLVNYVTSWV